MSTENSRLSYLFNKYLKKTTTPEELAELQSMVENPLYAEEISTLFRNEWDKTDPETPFFSEDQSERILNNIINNGEDSSGTKHKKNFLLWRAMAAAAVILIITGVSFNHYLHPTTSPGNSVSKTKLIHDALPGGNRAILTFGDGQTIRLDNVRNGLLQKQGRVEVNKSAEGQLAFKVSSTGKTMEFSRMNRLSVPKGGQYQISLSDGTKVWLNSASSLKFPTMFTGDYREVEITGEAYFEVKKDPSKPFKVKVEGTVIQVLGTHFNVTAYEDDDELKTTLLEGSVKMTSGRTEALLKPGDQGVVSTAGALDVKHNVDVEAETAWKNGLFNFNDDPLTDILRQMERWYDLKVSYEGPVPSKRLTGTISRNVNASQLLSMLSYTGINLKIEGKKIIVTNYQQTKK